MDNANINTAAALQAFGQIGSSAMGVVSAGQANARAMKMAREQREWNEQMYEKQKDFTVQMWHEQNAYNESQLDKAKAYNSPMAQMQRYKDAGINPYMAVGQMNAGNVEANTASSVSAPNVAPAPSADLQPIPYDRLFDSAFSALANRALMQAQIRSVNANALKMESEANIAQSQSIFADQMAQRGMEMINEQLAGIKNDNKHKELDYKHKDLLFDSTYRTAVANAAQTEQGIDLNRLTIESLELQNTASKLRNKYLPQELAVQLSTLRQNLANLVETKKLTIAQAAHAWALQGKAVAERVGVDLNNRFFQQTWSDRLYMSDVQTRLSLNQVNRDDLDTYWHTTFNTNKGFDGFINSYFVKPLEGALNLINPLKGLKFK